MKNKLTQKRLKEVLHYDPETGIFTRRIYCSPNAQVGDTAGSFSGDGYVIISINGISYPAHRLAFLYMEGYLPENQVDHINRIRSNNKWCNLREASQSCNMRNTGNQCNNKSGVKGISWKEKDQIWWVRIKVNMKGHSLGFFKEFDEAVFCRLAGEQCLDWNNCNSNSPAFDYAERLLGRKLKTEKWRKLWIKNNQR